MKGGSARGFDVGEYRALEKLLIREGEDTRSNQIGVLKMGETVHIEKIGEVRNDFAIRGKIKDSGWVSMVAIDYYGKGKNEQLLEFIPPEEEE